MSRTTDSEGIVLGSVFQYVPVQDPESFSRGDVLRNLAVIAVVSGYFECLGRLFPRLSCSGRYLRMVQFRILTCFLEMVYCGILVSLQEFADISSVSFE